MTKNLSCPANNCKGILIFYTVFISSVACLENNELIQKSQTIPVARVLHGENANWTEYLFVVALEISTGHYIPRLNITKHRICSGTLLNRHFVISAAHCLIADRIRYGDLTLPRTSKEAHYSYILRKIPHHDNHRNILRHSNQFYIHADIALFRVEPVHLWKYGTLSAVDYLTMTGRPVHYVGLGRTYSESMGAREKAKRFVKDEVRERQVGHAVVKPCDKIENGKVFPIICLAKKCQSEQDTAKGDSGGPLFYDGRIAGVCLGKVVVKGLRQTVFTPVSMYLDWIRTVMHIDE